MSIATEIERIQSAKASIKASIENKGVVVGDVKLDEYASKIDEIQAGGEDTSKQAILYSEYNDSGYPTKAKTNNEFITASVPNYCFYGDALINKSLKIIEFSSTVTSIGSRVCQYCTNLEQIDIPDTVGYIGMNAFYNCSKLRLEKLPLNLNNIGSYVFYGCEGIEKLIFENPCYIGSNSFQNCSNLSTIVFKNGVDSLSSTTSFRGTPIDSGSGYIYVPDDEVEATKLKTNWSTYANQIKPLSEYVGDLI